MLLPLPRSGEGPFGLLGQASDSSSEQPSGHLSPMVIDEAWSLRFRSRALVCGIHGLVRETNLRIRFGFSACTKSSSPFLDGALSALVAPTLCVRVD